jgi:RNA polymerase sigma-70 factor (ECF subfamily)
LQDFHPLRVKQLQRDKEYTRFMTETEAQLIRRAKRDPEAFGLLYDRYVDRIYAYALRQSGDTYIAQDITAAAFEKALRNIRRFRARGAGFAGWLYRIARNEAISVQRKSSRFVPQFDNQPSPLNVETLIQQNQQHAALYRALGKLSPGDQEILALRFFDDLNSAQVAAVIGVAPKTLYVRLSRALKKLRQHLGETDYE